MSPLTSDFAAGQTRATFNSASVADHFNFHRNHRGGSRCSSQPSYVPPFHLNADPRQCINLVVRPIPGLKQLQGSRPR